MTLPVGTEAFYFYAEQNSFDLCDITAQSLSGTMVTQNVNGSAGAAYYGFYTPDNDPIVSITVFHSCSLETGHVRLPAR